MCMDREYDELYEWAQKYTDAELRYVIGSVYIRRGYTATAASFGVAIVLSGGAMGRQLANKREYLQYLTSLSHDDTITDEMYDHIITLSTNPRAQLKVVEGKYVWEVDGKKHDDSESAYAAL